MGWSIDDLSADDEEAVEGGDTGSMDTVVHDSPQEEQQEELNKVDDAADRRADSLEPYESATVAQPDRMSTPPMLEPHVSP